MTTARLCIDRVRAWLDRYMDALEASVGLPDLQRYPLFYFPCQALFYIFCFRHSELINMRGKRGVTMLPGWPHARAQCPRDARSHPAPARGRAPLDGSAYMRELDFSRLVNSRFNPLKVRSRVRAA